MAGVAEPTGLGLSLLAGVVVGCTAGCVPLGLGDVDGLAVGVGLGLAVGPALTVGVA